jgi:hypothetical protein
VEDNDDDWELVQRRLHGSHALTRAKNDREACAALGQPDAFYAVLVDIGLAGSRIDGIQRTRLLRGPLPAHEQPDYARSAAASGVPVLFATAFGNAYPEQPLRAAARTTCRKDQ